MGNFKQHVTCSTITGIAIGGIAYQFGFSIPTCLLSAGLCSMAGMLPDIDSDSSRSFQECIYFAAGLCAVLFVDRLRQFNIDRDTVMLSGALMFLFIRFGVGDMIKKVTAHRGMFHSIPAAVFSGQIVFFLTTGTVEERLFKGFALAAGYLSHLILDEICSIDSTGKQLRIKKSFGTALKFYDGKRMGITLSLYAAIAALGILGVNNPEALGDFDAVEEHLLAEIKSSNHSMEDIMTALTHIRSGKPYTPPTSGKTGVLQSVLKEFAALHGENVPAIMPDEPVSPIVSQHQKSSEHQFFSKLRNGSTQSVSTSTTPSIAERMYSNQPTPIEQESLQALNALNPSFNSPNDMRNQTNNPTLYQAAMPTQATYQSYQQESAYPPAMQTESLPQLPFQIQGFQPTSLRQETSTSTATYSPPVYQSFGNQTNSQQTVSQQGMSPYELAMQAHQNPGNSNNRFQSNNSINSQNNMPVGQANTNNNPENNSTTNLPPFLQATPQQSFAIPSYNNNYVAQPTQNENPNNRGFDDGASANPYSLSDNDFAPRKKHQPGDMNRDVAPISFPNQFSNE